MSNWQHAQVGPWGEIRLQPRSMVAALVGRSRWIVEWRAGSQDLGVPAPDSDHAAWVSPDESRWHPLVLPRGSRRTVVRAAAEELRHTATQRPGETRQ